jgi:transcriptional regulator with XRE-family HTH domain
MHSAPGLLRRRSSMFILPIMATLQKTLAANIKLARTRLGFSQKHLAELSHLSACSIREIELGKRFPSPKNIEHLSEALGLRPYQIFYDKEQMELYDKYERLANFYCELNKKINDVLDDTTHKYLKASGVI